MALNRGELLKEILIGIGVLGLITITGAMAPNIFSALSKSRFSKRKYNQVFGKTVYYLKRKKLIIVKENPDGTMKVEISKNGKRKILEYDLEKIKIEPMKKWDRKWRFVMFDIPNKFKNRSNALRDKLKELGLYQFQKSVWVYPYPLDDEIEFIAKIFEVRPFIKLGTISELENEQKLKNNFKLK